MARQIWIKDKFHNVGFSVDKDLSLWLSYTRKAHEKRVVGNYSHPVSILISIG